MDEQLISESIDKIQDGTITDNDLLAFNQEMSRIFANARDLPIDEVYIKSSLWESIENERTNFKRLKVRKRFTNYSIAAILTLGFAIFILYKANFKLFVRPSVIVVQDRSPFDSFLSVTLPSGKKVFSQSFHDMEAAGFSTENDSSGVITFRLHSTSPLDTSEYRMLTTSAGGIFRLKLEDGTIIHLNANTALKVPVKFPLHKRMIELLRGEAFFNVAHNPTWPFTLKTNNATIEDLGTSFLVSTATNHTTTSLISGLLKVGTGGKSLALRPGQGVIVKNHFIGNPYLATENLHMDWMNGVFSFENEKLKNVMQRISNWYGVQTIWNESTLGDRKFIGVIDRRKPLSEVLEMITITSEVSFTLEGDKVFVK